MGWHAGCFDLIPGPARSQRSFFRSSLVKNTVDGSEILPAPVDMETLTIIYREAYHDSRDIAFIHCLHAVGGCIHHNISNFIVLSLFPRPS